MEKWKDIPGYEGSYQVSDQGRVRSLDRYVTNHSKLQFWPSQIIKQRHNRTGYVLVSLRGIDKKTRKRKVHRLVAMAFLSNNDYSLDVDHKDGNKDNNVLHNLEWVNRSENLRRAYKNGLRVSTFKNKPSFRRKLTNEQVMRARKDYMDGKTSVEIAKELGMSQSAAYDMLSGKHYRNVGGGCDNGEDTNGK